MHKLDFSEDLFVATSHGYTGSKPDIEPVLLFSVVVRKYLYQMTLYPELVQCQNSDPKEKRSFAHFILTLKDLKDRLLPLIMQNDGQLHLAHFQKVQYQSAACLSN